MNTIKGLFDTKRKMLSILLCEVLNNNGVDAVAQCIFDSSVRYDMPELLESIDKKMTEKYGNIK